MSQTLNITNYGPNNIIETTRLNAALAADSSSVGVTNTDGFVLNDYFAIGTLGADATELLVVSSVTAPNTITPTAHNLLGHPAYDYVTKLFGNQIKVYRAADVTGLQPADSDFTPVATINIQVDQPYTQYTDTGGGAGYWYKYTYYNQQTTAETNLADSKAVRGGSSGDYCSIYDIRIQAGFKNAPYVTDDLIDAKRQAAQDEINATLNGFYTVPFTTPINPFIADICKRLAAGLLMVEQYSAVSSTPTQVNGEKMMQDARADLQKLATKQIELTDTTGQSIAGAGSTGAIEGWPDDTTASANGSTGGAPRLFRMSDIQGQPVYLDDSGNPSGNPYYGRKW